MTDVRSDIRIDIDSTEALAGLRQLQTGISDFNRSVISSNQVAVASQKALNNSLRSSIEATGAFSTSFVNVESRINSFGNALDKGKLKLGEYFKYSIAASTRFTTIFGKEHETVMSLAEERVKRLQTQYIALGDSTKGMTKALAIRPLQLFNADAAITIQRQQLMNKLLSDGSTALVNFGKNTQWAGRQLMVGFSIPLSMFAVTAGKAFQEIEKATVSFRRVYGDTMTTISETDQATQAMKDLAVEYTKYGIAVSDTINLGAKAAATGLQGKELTEATAQATRLATLGQIEQNQALEATISLQSAFQISSQDLAKTVDFLNAVENQTITSLDDITIAIPKVAPVIKGLGGDVKDLATMLTAMREGGVSAAEGANALKSGLSSLINPTNKAKKTVGEFGINLDSIVQQNQGDLMGMVNSFAQALGQLDELSKQKVLTELFGKFQYARLGALFENIGRDGSQAQRVLELTGKSMEELSKLSQKELGMIENSIGVKFTASVERLKAAIAPVGETFMSMAVPIIDFVTNIFEKFEQLHPVIKNFIVFMTVGFGAIVPGVTMLVGLFANFIGQILKLAIVTRSAFQSMKNGGSALQYLSMAELDAEAATASLEGRVGLLTNRLDVQKRTVDELTAAYIRMSNAMSRAVSASSRGSFRRPPIKMATGGTVPGEGNDDTQPALLMPGEFVVKKDVAQKFLPFLQAMNRGVVKGFSGGTQGGDAFSTTINDMNMSFTSQQSLDRFQRVIAFLGDNIELQNKLVHNLLDISGGAKATVKHVEEAAATVVKTQTTSGSHLTTRESLDARGMAYLRSKKTIGAQRLLALANDKETARFLTQYSGLTASLSQSLNNKLDTRDPTRGASLIDFNKEWNAEGSRLIKSLEKFGSYTIESAEDVKALGDFERELGKRINAKAASLGLSTINDDLIATETKELIETYRNTEGALGKVAKAAYQASETVAQVGYSIPNLTKDALQDKTKYKAIKKDDGSIRYVIADDLPGAGTTVARLSKTGKLRTGGERYGRVANEVAYIILDGLTAALNKAARASSPSKVMRDVADNLVDGLVLGIKDGVVEVQKVGTTVGQSPFLFPNTSLGVPSATPKQLEQLKAARPQRIVAQSAGITVVPQELTNNLDDAAKKSSNLGNKILGLGAAVSAVSFALSFVEGPVGELANNIMMASMVLESLVFAGRALGAGKFIGSIASKIAPGLIAGGSVAAGGGAAAGGLAAIAAAAWPVVAVLGSIAAVGGLVYLSYKNVEDRLNRLGNAAKFSEDEIKGLGEAFGFTPRAINPFEIKTSGLVSGEEAAFAAEQVKKNESLQGKAKEIKGLTESEAAAALKGLFLDLLRKGASRDVATAIIEQVANEAGKQNVFVPVAAEIRATLNEDGSIKNVEEFIKASLNKTLDSTQEKLSKLNKTGFSGIVDKRAIDDAKNWMATIGAITPLWARTANSTYAQKAALIEVGTQYELYKTQVTEVLDNLAISLQAGTITADEYNLAMKGIEAQLTLIGNNIGIDILREKIATLSPVAATASQYINDTALAVAILQAAGAGANLDQLLQEISSAGFVADATREKILMLAGVAAKISQTDATISRLQAEKETFAKAQAEREEEQASPSSQLEDAINAIEQEQIPLRIAQIEIDQTAGSKLRAELSRRFGGLSFGISIDDFDDARYVVDQIGEQIEDIQRGPLAAAEDKIDAINEVIDDLKDKQDAINRQIDLYQQNIDKINEAYEKQIGPLQDIVDAHSQIVNSLEREIELATRDLQRQLITLENQRDVIEYNTNTELEGLEKAKEAFDERTDAALESYEEQRDAFNKMMDDQVKRLDDQIDRNNDAKDLIESQIDLIQKQIDGLEDVASINEIIARQQKNQLGLAEALTSGDMGAAAAAMLTAQQQSAQDAVELQKRGLEDQLDPLQKRADLLEAENDQIGKRTESLEKEREAQNELFDERMDAIKKEQEEYQKAYDLREKAASAALDSINKEIEAIEYQRQIIENNYDLRLESEQNLIEDQQYRIGQLEYERDLEIDIWQRKIDEFAPALRDLTNQIYVEEQKIKKIQEEQIEPLQKKIDALERQKALLDDAITDVETQIDREKDHYRERENALDLEKQILQARKQAADYAKQEADALASAIWGKQAELDAALAEKARLQKIIDDMNNPGAQGSVADFRKYEDQWAMAHKTEEAIAAMNQEPNLPDIGVGVTAEQQAYLQQGVNNSISLPSWITDLFTPVTYSNEPRVGKIQAEFQKIGTDSGNGFLQGLGDVLSSLPGKIWDWIVLKVQQTLGIKSPSTVMAAIGVDSGQGFMNGLIAILSKIPDQFMELLGTLKAKWDLWWAGMGQYWTVDIPRWWTVEAPAHFSTMMALISASFETWKNGQVQYWTVDIPRWWTVDLPNNFNITMALIGASFETWKKGQVQYWTVDIPRWWTVDMPRWWSEGFTSISSNFGSWILNSLSPKIADIKSRFQGIFDPSSWKAWATSGFNGIVGPINSLIKSFNDTIIATVNKALTALSLPTIQPLSGVTPIYSASGGSGTSVGGSVGTMRGLARGGTLPGYTPVSHGDDLMVPMRSGEGVIVSEALRNNQYEIQRLNDLNKAALSGSMNRFYEKHGYALGGVVGSGRIIPNATQGFNNYDPNALSAMKMWASATNKTWSMTGNGGARSFADQLRAWMLYQSGNGPLAANPWKGGPHMYPAIAMDMSPRPGEDYAAKSMLSSYGLGLPVPGEPWHVQYLAGRGGGTTGIISDVISTFNKLASMWNPPKATNVVSALGTTMLKGAVSKIQSALTNGMGAFSPTGFLGGVFTGGSGVERWRSTVSDALSIMGLPQSLQDTVLRRLNQESSGDPNAVNRWDSNWLRGEPSVGLMQVIRGTYNAYKHPSYDSGPYMYGVSTNPLSNILASMRYALGRYGSLPAAYNLPGGYAAGGIVGPLLRDFGGAIPTGTSMIQNNTGKTEWAFTSDQTEALVDLVGQLKFNMPSAAAFKGNLTVTDSGNVYNDVSISVVAGPNDSTEEIADKVVEKLARLQNNNVRGMGGFKRVSVR